ncbi:MAG: hypothetical protein R3Y07_09865 [Eubacteriales bacterium]
MNGIGCEWSVSRNKKFLLCVFLITGVYSLSLMPSGGFPFWFIASVKVLLPDLTELLGPLLQFELYQRIGLLVFPVLSVLFTGIILFLLDKILGEKVSETFSVAFFLSRAFALVLAIPPAFLISTGFAFLAVISHMPSLFESVFSNF